MPSARLADPAALERGRSLFLEHCAICHGEHADGHGQRRAAFVEPPADFTNRAWRREQSARRVYFMIREGKRGTAMPAWKSLSESDSWDLTAYVLSVAERRQ